MQTEATDNADEDDCSILWLAEIACNTSWLHMWTSAEAMALLITLECVFSDMMDWINHGELDQKIVLREFSDAFNLST